MVSTGTGSANRLINEKSPYLLQHAYNPVDWYPWGEEAFARARAENKPVFLSIGYSTCHWCHVMERESFEDTQVAELLNKYFIPVKVDREERPDLDQIFMTACQALTGQGGWPLTVVLTPDKKPFFAGTYFPREPRYGISGMTELLPRLASLWERDPEKAAEAGAELLKVIREHGRAGDGAGGLPGPESLDLCYRRLSDSFDEQHGGFGGAPKFPVPHQLTFLLRYWKRSGEQKALDMVDATLKAMARGGIFDQLGYGFHRYATDAAWLVPHFEKMLYDQALLALAYLEAFQCTGDGEHALTARRVFEYMLRDLAAPGGAFCAAEDADSEGQEGLFYIWTRREIVETLGRERGEMTADYFGVTEKGNFEHGRSIPYRPEEMERFAAKLKMDPAGLIEALARSREQLLKAREKRVRPFKDDKILTAWNGLAVAALARGAAVLDEPHYARAAGEAAGFIGTELTDAEGRLRRRYRDGEAGVEAFLDDYAFLAWGLSELYQATFRVDYLDRAVSLTEKMLELFRGEGGAFNYTPAGTAADLPPYQDAYDGATPSGNSVAAFNLLKIGRMTGRRSWEERGEAVIRAFAGELTAAPSSFTFMLSALDFALGPAAEAVLAGERGDAELEQMAAAVRRGFYPRTVLLHHPSGPGSKEAVRTSPFLEPMAARDGTATAYLCRNRSCLPPVSSTAQLVELLETGNGSSPGSAESPPGSRPGH